MNSLGQNEVPHRPSEAAMATYTAQFSSLDDAAALVSRIVFDGVTSTASVYTDFLRHMQQSRGRMAKDARRIGDVHLRVIFNAIAAAGLPAFAPDVFGNEESLYNLVHEHLAIHTFRTVAMSWAYTSLYVFPMPLLEDHWLLRSFYRSYIYGYMGRQSRKMQDRIPQKGGSHENMG